LPFRLVTEYQIVTWCFLTIRSKVSEILIKLHTYVNDQVISDISKLLGSLFKLLNAISSTDLIDVLERALQEPNLDKAIMDPPRVGMWGFLSALRNKEVQRGMEILIKLLKAIGKAAMELK